MDSKHSKESKTSAEELIKLHISQLRATIIDSICTHRTETLTLTDKDKKLKVW
jgi:hypothetical protein